ncbi:hypothetical protein M885DRAFT_540308 [Pelagophyceae sp. CCMP2097]|nr:hypothetical protein M885DRAFT_540308 [Pelagophyceae sp. CCMP2097]
MAVGRLAVLLALGVTSVAGQAKGYRHGNWIAGTNAPDEIKAQWADKPPLVGPAPDARKSPVRPPAPKDRPPREPVALGDALWKSPAIRPIEDQDVVIGLALNYKLGSHSAFVGTLRRTGYKGDIILATEPLKKMQLASANFLKDMGVVAFPLEPDCSASKGGSIKHKTCLWREGQPALPLAIIRHALYHAIASMYPPSAQFYVADYRDTFFQRNPFEAYSEIHGKPRLKGLDLVVVAEHWPFKQIGNCPFNGGWVRGCWGADVHQRLQHQNVLCSGSYMGAQPAIVNFEETLLASADVDECHFKGVPSDQGYLNYLFYSGLLPSETVVESRGSGVVNTVGSLDGSRPRKAGFLPDSHVNIGEYWHMRDADGFVMQDDSVSKSAAVHQYDRFHLEFTTFVAELGLCDPPETCYRP